MPHPIITFLASFLIWFMFAGLIALWLVNKKVKRELVLRAFLASFIAWSISEIIKSLFPTLRPFEVSGATPLTITVPFDSAFPSGHAALSFALATSVWSNHKRLGIVFILSAVAVGVGRVLGNVHYLVDIVGGGALGVTAALTIGRMDIKRPSPARGVPRKRS